MFLNVDKNWNLLYYDFGKGDYYVIQPNKEIYKEEQ